MTITEKRRLGDIGENAACEFLRRRGYEVIERNYLRKWGELDVVAKKGSKIHFVEVKSVSCVTARFGSHETPRDSRGLGSYRPEENVHPQKLKRLARAIQTYILERKLDGVDWQFDIITAKIDEVAKKAHVELLEDIVIS